MKNIFKIIGLILCIISVPILIVNTTLIVKTYLNPNEIPGFLGYKPFIVLSGSMEPNIMTGDIAIIKEYDTKQLKENDVIAFRMGNSVITHRILEITEDNGETVFITKGDNNNIQDKYPVQAEQVEGIFLARIPKLGDLAMFLQTTVGTILCIAIPFTLFMIHDIIERKREKELQLQKQAKLEKELKELKKQKEDVVIK